MNASDTPKFAEEEKNSGGFSQFYLYAYPVKEHVNPLVHNKGSASFPKDPPPKPVPSLHLSKKSESVSDVLKFDSVLSFDNDCSPSGMSEFYPSEKSSAIDSSFQLPLFEIHHTMYVLAQQKKREAQQENDSATESPVIPTEKPASIGAKMPYKSYSMQQAKNDGLEALAADLSPQQYAFLKKVYAYKSNYLFHALNLREVYFQYVAITKEIMKLSTSEDILVQLNNLVQQSKKYPKDPVAHKGTSAENIIK